MAECQADHGQPPTNAAPQAPNASPYYPPIKAASFATLDADLVLVASPDPDIEGMVYHELEAEGFRVKAVNDPRQLLHLATRSRPVAAVLDLLLSLPVIEATIAELRVQHDTHLHVTVVNGPSQRPRRASYQEKWWIATVLPTPFELADVVASVYCGLEWSYAVARWFTDAESRRYLEVCGYLK